MLSQAQTIITNTIICSVCGGAGHISSDCKLKNSTEKPEVTWQDREKMDNEVKEFFFGFNLNLILKYLKKKF